MPLASTNLVGNLGLSQPVCLDFFKLIRPVHGTQYRIADKKSQRPCDRYSLNNSAMSNFAERVRAARKKAGLSQTQLAGKAGLSQTTISDIERGRNEGSRDVVALARALKVEADWLVNGGNTPKQAKPEKPPLPRLTPDQLMLAEIYPSLPAEKKSEMLDRMVADPDRYRALLDALLTEVAYSTVRAGGGVTVWDGVERRKQVPNHG